MSRDQEIERGRLAQQIMREGGPVALAFEVIKARYIKAWEAAGSSEERERLHLAVTIAGQVRQHLQSQIGSGKLAQAEIEALQGRRKGLLRLVGAR